MTLGRIYWGKLIFGIHCIVMVVLTIFMFKKKNFFVIFPRAMHDMDWTHYDGAERSMSEAKQVFAFKNRWSQSLTLIREVQADVSKQSLDYKAKRGLSTMKPEFEEKKYNHFIFTFCALYGFWKLFCNRKCKFIQEHFKFSPDCQLFILCHN